MEDIASHHLPAGGQEAYWQPVMGWGAESSDEELMLGYRDGDAAAFDVLYARHKGGVYRYLYRQCRDAAAAEELFQDVWMNLIRARAGYTVQAKFTTYLYRLAHNRLIDHYRKNSVAAVSSFEDMEGETAEELPDDHALLPDAAHDSREQARRLLQLLAELPEA